MASSHLIVDWDLSGRLQRDTGPRLPDHSTLWSLEAVPKGLWPQERLKHLSPSRTQKLHNQGNVVTTESFRSDTRKSVITGAVGNFVAPCRTWTSHNYKHVVTTKTLRNMVFNLDPSRTLKFYNYIFKGTFKTHKNLNSSSAKATSHIWPLSTCQGSGPVEM